jgi:hypothetical protein
MKAFISYSHKDEKYLERLKVHLAPMKRENLIAEWTDQEIHAGSGLNNIIGHALASSELFLALISPDYISSDYCYNKEFETAQKMQNDGILKIVPIIVEPCDWKQTPFGNLKALPKDGKAVSEWTNPNNAFLNIIDELRRLTQPTKSSIPFEDNSNGKKLVTKNYKIKKHFSEVDRYNFKESSYEEIKKYFYSSISEINSVENLQARFTFDGKGHFTCIISNRANSQSSFLTIQIGTEAQRHFGDLSYSFSETVATNTIQIDRIFSIENDEYMQFWTRNLHSFNFSNQTKYPLSAHQVAEIIWNDFISKVGVSLE